MSAWLSLFCDLQLSRCLLLLLDDLSRVGFIGPLLILVGLIGLILDSDVGVVILLGRLSLLSVGLSLGGDFSFELGVGLIKVSTLGQNDDDLSGSLVLAHGSLGLDASDFSVLVVHEHTSEVDSHGDTDLTSTMHFKSSELVLE